jgi:hypothetical protein
VVLKVVFVIETMELCIELLLLLFVLLFLGILRWCGNSACFTYGWQMVKCE